MTGLEIAAIIAMITGSAMQYKASNDAAKRQAEETRRSIERQEALQKDAEKKALGQAQEMNTGDRMEAQEQIAQELTQEFLAPVESAQQINAGQSTTQGDVSADYTAARAKSELNVAKNARALAGFLGKTTAAGRLRGNEAIRFSDTAAGIDRLGNFSRGQEAADRIAIGTAGRPNAGLMLGGQLLQGLGSLGIASGTGSASSGTPAFDSASTASAWQSSAGGATGATGSAAQYGVYGASPFVAGGGTGLKAGRSTLPISYGW